MKHYRIYIDTSVFGGVFDDEFSKASSTLFNQIDEGLFIPLISNATVDELLYAPDQVKKILENLKSPEYFEITEEMTILASHYLKEKIITPKYRTDAIHIAAATIKHADVLVSWNFKHLVNLKKIHLVNSINFKYEYQMLEIRSPLEVIESI